MGKHLHEPATGLKFLVDDAVALFKRLGIDVRSLSAMEFTAYYFALAKRYHPDRGNQKTHELMANIIAARTTILKKNPPAGLTSSPTLEPYPPRGGWRLPRRPVPIAWARRSRRRAIVGTPRPPCPPCANRNRPQCLLRVTNSPPIRVPSVLCGRPRRSKGDLVCCAAVGCGHVSGLRCAVLGPLALMQSAAWLPTRFTRWNGA